MTVAMCGTPQIAAVFCVFDRKSKKKQKKYFKKFYLSCKNPYICSRKKSIVKRIK